MSYTLVIVESPSKCKKIEHFLNEHIQSKSIQNMNYKCLASFGHIRELAGIQSINIHNKFEPTFVMCESKKDQIAKLRKAINEANQVILATDDDREGEAIAWHLCEVFHLPLRTTPRILFHEITETALRKAIDTPSRVNMSVVHAQLARQVLDMLVGYKVSPLLWQHVKDGLSAGRCQTPALRLIYDNQKEVEAASAQREQVYTITGYFTSKTIPFILNHEETDETALQAFLKASIGFAHCYKECKLQNKQRAAPEPFTTSSLQQTCSNELHLSPKETMSICQKLYEGGYITYPRTDSQTYSEEFLKIAHAFIKDAYGSAESMLQPITNLPLTSEAAAAHEAIRVTHLKCLTSIVSETATAIEKKMDKVYQLIRRRTLESCMAAAVVSVLSATVTAPSDREYHYTAEHIVFAGWKKVKMDKAATAATAATAAADEESKYYTFLQALKLASVLPCQKIKANVTVKGLKAHVTEARLVQLLEEQGIGRPSTFSSIIEKIQERKYVAKENVKGKMIKCVDYELTGKEVVKITMDKEFGNEKNKLIIQPVGILALEFLVDSFDHLFNYAYTKQMEDNLDAVARDEKKWYDVCQTCYDTLERLMAAITKRGKETIRIDDNHTYMVGKYGPVIKVTGTGTGTGASAGTGTGASAGTPFKAVRKDIDLNKLRRGEYTLEDVLEKNASSIGIFKEWPVYVKAGKFGKYLEWNGTTQSLKHLKKTLEEITMDDVLEVLYDNDNGNGNGAEAGTGALRTITEDASIRKGKYGNYIFYKTSKMKKPRFLKLDGFSGGDYLTCDLLTLQEWFKNTYKV